MITRLMAHLTLALAFASAALAQSSWTVRHERAGGDDLWGIASGANGLVAVGTNGVILHSTDGATWTRRSSGTNTWLTAVTYGNGRYLAVGEGALILSSTDGVSWSAVAHAATTQRLNNIVFALDRFAAVGERGTILTSVDGATWTAVNSSTTRWLRGLAFGRGTETGEGGVFSTEVFLATGQAGTALMSSDAITWNPIDLQTSADLEAAVFRRGNHSHPVAGPGGGVVEFVVSGHEGTIRIVSISKADSLPLTFITPAVTSVASGTTQPIRALLAGARSFNRFTISASSQGLEQAAPVTAIDETGRALSDFAGTGAGAWRAEATTTTAPLRAGTYSSTHAAFFAVGARETIATRGELFNGRPANISTRGFVEGSAQSLIAGFVIRGTAPKRVLIRGIGPALANFGLTNALAQPTLTLFDGRGAVLATNAGWETDATPNDIASTATRVGAFALTPGSRDAALLVELSPGNYSAQITGAGGTSGAALVEVYDADPAANGISRAINLSTRGRIGVGTNALVAGLVVEGPQWRKFLVRGAGPSLTNFGVAGALPDPIVRISAARNFGGTSGTYVNSSDVASATAATGAFPFGAGSRDEAFVITVPPGVYTFDLTSSSNATGVALIEIYEVGILPGSF